MDLTDFAKNHDTRAIACQLLGCSELADPVNEVDFLKLVAEYHLHFIAPVNENETNDGIVGFYASNFPIEIDRKRFQPITINSGDISFADTSQNSSLAIFQLPSPCTRELLSQVLGKISKLPRYSFFYISMGLADPLNNLFSRWLFSFAKIFKLGITEMDERRIFIGSVLAIGHKREFDEIASLPEDNLYPLVEIIPAEENKPDPDQIIPNEINYLRSQKTILHPAKIIHKPAYSGEISPLATSGPGKGLYVSSHQEQSINAPYMYEITAKDALVHGSQLFFTVENYLIGDSIGGQHLNPGLLRSGIHPIGRTQSYTIPAPSGKILQHDKLFLLGNRRTNGYYHWIVDVFPRFKYYRPFQGKFPFLSGAKSSFALEMLKL